MSFVIHKEHFQTLSRVHFVYLLFVIVFGAFVRATGSGAGCGSHWPLCNGEVVPPSLHVKTVIEYTHRLTSTFLLFFSIALVRFGFRLYSNGHVLRKLLVTYLVVLFLEILFGAALVLLGHVAENQSIYRGFSISMHLLNTMILSGVAFLICCSSLFEKSYILRSGMFSNIAFVLGLILILITSLSGTITALGDTLFPVTSIQEAITKSLSASEHLFVKLRIYHPFIAVMSSFYLLLSTWFLCFSQEKLKYFYMWLALIVAGQLFFGFVNVHLLAPTWLQIIHLLIAHCVWVCYILFIIQYTIS